MLPSLGQGPACTWHPNSTGHRTLYRIGVLQVSVKKKEKQALHGSVLPDNSRDRSTTTSYGVSPRLSLFLPIFLFFHHLTYSLEFWSLEDFGSMSSIHPSVKVRKPLIVFLEKLLLGSGNIHTWRLPVLPRADLGVGKWSLTWTTAGMSVL